MAVSATLANRASRFVRVAAWSQRHAVVALVLWVGVLIAVSVAAQLTGTRYHNDISLPGTESQRLLDSIRTHAPDTSGDPLTVVMHDDAGITSPQTRAAVQDMLADLRTLPSVAAVSSPFGRPPTLSADSRIAYATVTLDRQAADVPAQDIRAIIDTAEAAGQNGLTVELGGDAVGTADGGGGGAAEGAGILAALAILVLMFGSLLAASLPLMTAILAVGSAIGLISLAAHLTDVASYTTPLMVLVGLGVGIDYALLVFSRYRSELLSGAAPDAAIRRALDTAGRAVLFAGATVIIALLGLLALGLGSLQSVALAVAATVLVTVLAALTLLPALLTMFGRRIDRGIRKRAKRTSAPAGEGWRRWAVRVQRRPVLAASAGIGVLLALAAPALDLRLGIADAGTDPQTQTTRRAYDLLAEGFGPGSNGPLIMLVEGSAQAAAVAGTAVSSTPGVASATPPQQTSDGQAWLVFVIPDSAPQDRATTELVTRLRHDVLPPLAAQTGATYLVGGSPAAAGDFAAAVSSRLPIFVLMVLGLSALLLMVVFRSLLIPVKAALLNLLTIGACLGVVTIVFQRGLLGAQPAPVEAFLPVMIFAIVFGLSMDYEVFLLAGTHEEWRRTDDPDEAVREGLAATGGVITAAAAIMIVVFSSFLFSPDRMLREFGLGLAVAVLVDAFVIRCLVVPAVMRLLGRRAWWLPAPLERVLPRIPLEPVRSGDFS